MSWKTEALGDLLAPTGNTRAGKQDLPVMSITMHSGLVDQSSKFKKRVASQDISSYRIVFKDELVVGFPIDEGVLGFQTKYPAAVVSPAYGIWKLRRPAETHIPFVEAYLRSNVARQIYASKMRGAVARRRSLRTEDFLGIDIPWPPIEEQKKIASVLRMVKALRCDRNESLQLIEQLLQSVFVDMFGDPVTNPKGWPTRPLSGLGIVQTGNTPPRNNKDNYAPSGLEWIKTDNIIEHTVYITHATEHLSEMGERVARIAPAGSLLVACIAGSEKSIGRAALTDRPVAFNQQINAITPNADTSPLFLYFMLKVARRQVQLAAGKGMKKIINKSTFESLVFIAPSQEHQRRFEAVANKVLAQNAEIQEQVPQLDALFSSIQSRAFRNQLDLSRLTVTTSSEEPPAPELGNTPVESTKPTSSRPIFQIPQVVETVLKELDETVRTGEPIPWSAAYFKYRILGAQSAPFSFSEVMQKAESIFDDPPYEEIKDIVMDLLGKGGSAALLTQTFDLNIDADTKEASGRKEIVFGPLP